MTHGAYDSELEFRNRLEAIEMAVQIAVGVSEIEYMLVDLLAFLKSGRIDRATASKILSGLIEAWPGAPEVLEFTMRDLRWPEIKAALEEHAESGADFRTRDMAVSVLQAYEEEWPGGEIYRTYRQS